MAYYLYTSIAAEDKIAVFTMDPETGQLLPQKDVALGGGPGPLAVDPELRFVYAGLRSSRQLASLRIDQKAGGMSLIGTVSLDADPCYITTDRKGRFLLSSYYGAGVAAVHAIGADGAVASAPIEWLSTAGKAHSIQTDPSNRFAFVPHVVPANAIFQFEFDQNTGALTPNAVPAVRPEEPLGPRHFCFHPSMDVAYFANEQGCSVTAYHFDSTAGTLRAFQTISTLPEGFEGENSCAQIQITPSGKIPVCSQPRSRLHCLFLRRRVHGRTDRHWPSTHRGGPASLRHRSRGPLPFRRRSGFGGARRVPHRRPGGGPRASGDLRGWKAAHVGAHCRVGRLASGGPARWRCPTSKR